MNFSKDEITTITNALEVYKSGLVQNINYFANRPNYEDEDELKKQYVENMNDLSVANLQKAELLITKIRSEYA